MSYKSKEAQESATVLRRCLDYNGVAGTSESQQTIECFKDRPEVLL